MKNFDKTKPKSSGLRPITVRFTAGAWEAIREIAEENKLSQAELIRMAVAGNLAEYLGTIRIIDQEQAEGIKSAILSLLGTMSQIENELNRIGVNFNQEIRLRNIEAKSKNTTDYRVFNRMESEKKTIMAQCKGFNKSDLDALIGRYEEATKKVGDFLCHILA